MEATGVVFRQGACLFPATGDGSKSRCLSVKKPTLLCVKEKRDRKLFAACVFSDKSHLQYYNGPRMEVKEKEKKKEKEMKKKMKVLKGLSKNLDTFSEMGFGLNLDDGLDQQVKGQMISEATEVLLAQLQKLKEEKMESKRLKKEEKAKKKASKMMMKMKTECKDSSSSSSESSSSESDCDNINNVVNMSQLKTEQEVVTPPVQTLDQILEKVENKVTETAICNVSSKVDVDSGKKIEVCMGGKCKKSGAAMLLESFEKAVGGEVEVVGCKCMGKCRDAPNVKVRGEEKVSSSMCIGVGLDDVESIVTSFFGGSRGSGSGMVPALSSV